MRKVVARFNPPAGGCNLTGNRPQSATFHTLYVGRNAPELL
jgi:hypothetical protein